METLKKIFIHSIRLKEFHNDGHFQYHVEFTKLVVQVTAVFLKVEALWAEYAARFAVLDAAFKKIVCSALTEMIRKADAERDAAFVGITKFNKVVLDYHYDANFRESARQIDIVLRTYGNVAAKPLSEETSAIYNLVQELQSAKYAAHVARVGLTAWVEKLGQLNNTVETLFEQRDAEAVSKTHVTMKDARRDIDDVYKDIVETINAYIKLGQLPGSEEFVEKLNMLIHRFTTMLKRQQSGHGGHGAVGPEAEELPETEEVADEPVGGEVAA